MRTTKLQNLPLRTESSQVKGGLNPQPLPPRYLFPIRIIRYGF